MYRSVSFGCIFKLVTIAWVFTDLSKAASKAAQRETKRIMKDLYPQIFTQNHSKARLSLCIFVFPVPTRSGVCYVFQWLRKYMGGKPSLDDVKKEVGMSNVESSWECLS